MHVIFIGKSPTFSSWISTYEFIDIHSIILTDSVSFIFSIKVRNSLYTVLTNGLLLNSMLAFNKFIALAIV